MTKMNKKREYTHEDMEALGKEIEVLRIRARQVDEDIRNGAISHEQWVSAAQELMERHRLRVRVIEVSEHTLLLINHSLLFHLGFHP